MSDEIKPVVVARNLRQVYQIRRGMFKAPAQLQAVGGISFAIDAGKTLAVVGESGCGKSTLARMVSLIEKPVDGSLTLDGTDAVHTPASDKRRLRQAVQLVFQNPYGSLNPRKKVSAVLEDPLAINTTLSRAERAERARDMLAKVGLRPEYANRYPHMFSGGQRQRIAIARALMLEPKLLVADEPVSALDVSIQAQVLNLLADLQSQMRLAYLFISHDLAVVRHIAHDVLVMYLGHVMEQGHKEDIFARPSHPYTQALLASTPGMEGRKVQRIVLKGELPSPLNPPSGCVFSGRCPYAVERCRAERPLPRDVGGRIAACHFADQYLHSGFPSVPTSHNPGQPG
jgi:dipeptide transport system ATP-binding protein